MANECAEMEDTLQSRVEKDEKQDESDELHSSAETYQDDLPETSFKIKDPNPMDAYKRAAPVLLNELAHLLSQHNWTEEGCIPHGIVNILNYSWQDLTAGAVLLKSPEQTEIEEKFKFSPILEEKDCSNQGSAIERCESGGRSSPIAGERKQEVSSKQLTSKRNPKTIKSHNLTTFSFSFPSDSIKDPGWIIQPKLPSCDEPQRISSCQWVVERLQAARDPENLQTTEQDLNQLVTLRYYGENLAEKRPKRKAQPSALANRTSQILEAKQLDSARQRLHYKIKDSSSFIYYQSGCMAVCQSCSGLPRGGFYTNVFSDSKSPVIMATITAFGHGTVSSVISAVWDQDGGFMSDLQGNITKKWSWQEYRTPREKIVIQVSDRITVKLFSGTSAVLCFRCDKESIQLRLSALVNIHKSMKMPCLQTKEKFTSDFAQDLLLTTTTKSPAVLPGSKTNLMLTPMVREVEELEEQSGQLRRGGHVSRELKKLQERVRNIVDDWLGYYRSAIGIKCPGVERMPDALLRTRLRRAVQSAALPSLNPPERADAEPVQLEDGRNELQKPHRHLSAPAERPLDAVVKLPRSVIILTWPNPQPSDVPSYPAPPQLNPATPLTVCPVLLRAALLGEKGRKRCCCSATLMPALTDLEYDAFIMGQPRHSQQMLVVCVTPQPQPVNTHPLQYQVVLEQLYKMRNRHRAMPCTQCQKDSYRLLRYEMSTRKPSCEEESLLLQQRHNAAPGMVLMYMRGKLLFVGYIFSDHSCSVRDLENQISRSRGDYRLGLSIPSDYKFRDPPNASAEEEHKSQDEKPKDRKEPILTASLEIANANKRKNSQVPQVSHQKQRDSRIKPKKAPALPPIPVITN